MKEEEKKLSSRKIGIQSFFKKRWVYPAVYILAAAIILASFLWFQSRDNTDNKGQKEDQFGYEEHSGRGTEEDAIEAGSNLENFKWPVVNADEVEIVTPFYDAAKSQQEQEAAILYYGNSFQPNTGISIAAKNGEAFDVLASMSGIVTMVEQDSVLGNVVVVEHADGIETRYQALDEVYVKAGDKIVQGQKLGKAGTSLINQDAGVHLHFEIRKDDVPVNPLDYFEKSLSALQNTKVDDQKKVTEKKGQVDEEADENEGENSKNPTENN